MSAALAVPFAASPRALHIARTLAGAFEAIKELQKSSPSEASQLMETVAAHVRSAAPQAMLAEQKPLSSVKVPVGEHGAFYGITVVGTGVVLVVSEASGRDAATPPLTPVQAEALCRDVMAVTAAVEAIGG